jgi:hypothetical protein
MTGAGRSVVVVKSQGFDAVRRVVGVVQDVVQNSVQTATGAVVTF